MRRYAVLLTGAALMLTGCSSGDTDALSSSVQSLQGDVASLQSAQSAIVAAQAAAPTYGDVISSMQAQLSQIQQSPTLSAPVSSPPSSSAASSPANVKTRYTKSIILNWVDLDTSNDTADLDDDGSGAKGTYDISYVKGSTLALNGGAQAQLLNAGAPGPADYTTCSTATFSDAGIDVGNLNKGAVICVRTNENRVAALQLVDVTPSQVSFTSTTYDPPLG